MSNCKIAMQEGTLSELISQAVSLNMNLNCQSSIIFERTFLLVRKDVLVAVKKSKTITAGKKQAFKKCVHNFCKGTLA